MHTWNVEVARVENIGVPSTYHARRLITCLCTALSSSATQHHVDFVSKSTPPPSFASPPLATADVWLISKCVFEKKKIPFENGQALSFRNKTRFKVNENLKKKYK